MQQNTVIFGSRWQLEERQRSYSRMFITAILNFIPSPTLQGYGLTFSALPKRQLATQWSGVLYICKTKVEEVHEWDLITEKWHDWAYFVFKPNLYQKYQEWSQKLKDKTNKGRG